MNGRNEMKDFILLTEKGYVDIGEPIKTRILLRKEDIGAVIENKFGCLVVYSDKGGKISSIVVDEKFEEIQNLLYSEDK